LQIAFVDPVPKPTTPPPTQMASASARPGYPSSGVVQASGTVEGYPSASPIPTGPVMSTPLPSGTVHGDGMHPGPVPGDAMHAAPMPAGPGVPVEGHPGTPGDPSCQTGAPHEKAMRSLPPYMIEPPDILLIDTIRMIPKPPYLVSPLDVLIVRVAEPLPNQPIEGTYTVAPDGTINLGYSYGLVRVAGLTLEEVERAIRNQLARVLKDPQVAVGVAQFRGIQQARGEHLVRMDGTISLGTYGCVYVAGLTLAQAKVAIERHLSHYVLDPEVTVDVSAYNSKEFFIITDGAGYGEQVFRFPITGSETVLRAVSLIQGLPAVASKKKIWVARPAPAHHECLQILPVDWRAITEGGATATNYQLFPGDRLYIHSDPLICLDNTLAKILSPIDRLLSTALLFGSVINTFRSSSGNGNNNGGASFVVPLR
jgi:polysaccharide export outer membrane protein